MPHDSTACNHEDIINKGLLDREGNKTAMVARCFLSAWHEGNHCYSYDNILLKDLPHWRICR